MNRESILVVDDNQDNLKLTRILLEREGFQVHTVENAEQALIAIEMHPPALILMDVQLPGMDGLALTRLLRQGNTAHVPIVAFSAAAFEKDEELARSAGCDGYITKPIDTRTFAGLVRGYLERARPTAQTQPIA